MPLMAIEIHLERILVPTDFSDHAEQAIRHAAAIARWSGAELIVLHVVEKFMDYSLLYSDIFPFQTPTQDAYRVIEDRIKVRISTALEEFAAEGLRSRALVTTGSPHVEIIRISEREAVDLVVIATHGRSGLTHAILGSTAEKVVRRAPCPVLVIRKNGRDLLVEED